MGKMGGGHSKSQSLIVYPCTDYNAYLIGPEKNYAYSCVAKLLPINAKNMLDIMSLFLHSWESGPLQDSSSSTYNRTSMDGTPELITLRIVPYPAHDNVGLPLFPGLGRSGRVVSWVRVDVLKHWLKIVIK